MHLTLEDNMELMDRYPDNYFDLSIVDPPYGLNGRLSQGAGKLKNRNIQKMQSQWDVAPKAKYFEELFRISKNQIIWGGNYFGLGAFRCFLVWNKDQPFENFSQAEIAWTSFDTPAKLKTIPTTRTREHKIHPTQKPVALYEWIFRKYAKEGDKILDTHLGSGSIAIALHRVNEMEKMNLHLTACEIDSDYFKDSIKRIKAQTAQKTIFG